ncbi:MAG: SUMF1/EgtB/PvdO family nonheme iron enzyme [Planctomycetes bacterium]|nr:SUMF1/EgtB/PvdO family nonheme iron enzyme [Planctomycetota bacterium]
MKLQTLRTAGRLGTALLILAVLSSATIAQGDRSKIRKAIRKTESEIEATQKQRAAAQELLEKRKVAVADQHTKAFSHDAQIAVGKELSAAISAQLKANGPDGLSLEPIYEVLERSVPEHMGASILEAARKDLRDAIAFLMDDLDAAPDEIRCARTVDEALKARIDNTSFDKAWDLVLAPVQDEFRALAEIDMAIKRLQREAEELHVALTAEVQSSIPRGMVPVPSATNAELGASVETIKKMSEQVKEDFKENHFLLLGSQTEKKSIAAFMIDRFEVTHLMYWYFCEQTNRDRPRYKASEDPRTGLPIFQDIWPDGKIPEGWEHRPVTYVTYEDALAYSEWTGCRLPDEDEWEVAARSGKSGYEPDRRFPYGREFQAICGNVAENHDHELRRNMVPPKGLDFPAALPVGMFEQGATPLGIYDLSGNVAEWTSSSFTPRKSFDDAGFKDLESKFNEDFRVVRGGHCDQPGSLTAAFMRLGVNPAAAAKFVGFRRARSGAPGADYYARLGANRRLDSRLQDFQILPTDKKEKREIPALDTDPGRSAIMEDLAWNEELGVPGAYRAIYAINRHTRDLDNINELNNISKKKAGYEDAVLVGVFHTDVPILEPSLAPGTYFVTYDFGWKEKDGRKQITIKPAFVFFPLRVDVEPVRLESSGAEIFPSPSKDTVATSLSKVSVEAKDDQPAHELLTVSYSLPKAGRGDLMIEMRLKVAAGALAAFD